MNDSFSQGNLKYSILNEDPASKTGTVSVSRNRGEPKDRIGTTLNISPSIEHNGIIYTITRIESEAFYGCASLTCIMIPESVTSIGWSAFRGCTSLASITIPECVSRIGNGAFQGCKDVVGITIPDSLTSIGDVAFDGCRSLACITIPEGVTRIGIRAFDGCENLKDVYFKGAPLEMHNGTFKIDTVFHYVEGTPGWTTPRWKGFRTYIWKPEE